MGHVMSVRVQTMKMSEMKDRFEGRPAAVLGGGPSLPADMERLPAGCLLIAVNNHAFHVCEPDFMVYNDRPVDHPDLGAAIYACAGKVTRVSSDPTSDVLFDVDVWTGFYSSNTATWFACWLGCDPVILCGMDCYQGEKKYFHEWTRMPGLVDFVNLPLEHHIRPWIEDSKNMCPHSERIRAMSGPLVSVFGAYL
jgi:hypothetical protein